MYLDRKGILQEINGFFREEDGVTVVEVILILVVLIALVLIFKTQLTNIVKHILEKVSKQSNSV